MQDDAELQASTVISALSMKRTSHGRCYFIKVHHLLCLHVLMSIGEGSTMVQIKFLSKPDSVSTLIRAISAGSSFRLCSVVT